MNWNNNLEIDKDGHTARLHLDGRYCAEFNLDDSIASAHINQLRMIEDHISERNYLHIRYRRDLRGMNKTIVRLKDKIANQRAEIRRLNAEVFKLRREISRMERNEANE